MPLIELDGVSHHYGALRVLHEVTFSVEPGAIGLIGQNGAGKSTLLKILLGLMQPTQGTGSVLGFDIRRQSRLLRSRVGFMPEAESLIPGVDIAVSIWSPSPVNYPACPADRPCEGGPHEVLSHLELDELALLLLRGLLNRHETTAEARRGAGARSRIVVAR